MKILLFLIPTILLSSCGFLNCTEGEGNIVTRSFPQETFTHLEMGLSADVELIQSTKNEIEIILTYENLFEKLEINNRGEKLEVETDGCVKMNERTKIRVFFINIEEIDVDGSGNVIGKSIIKAEDLQVDIQGSGNVDLTVESDRLEAGIMGSGDIVLKGSAKTLDISINGSGNIKATSFVAERTEVTINGSGDAQLGNCNNLSSKVNGSGNVDCSGNK